MKKIIITESQARRLKIINENINPVDKIVQYSEIKTDILNELFKKIINNPTLFDANNFNTNKFNTTKFDYKKLDDQISKIYDELISLAKEATTYVNDMSADEFKEEDVKVDDAISDVKEKLYILKEIVSTIGDLDEDIVKAMSNLDKKIATKIAKNKIDEKIVSKMGDLIELFKDEKVFERFNVEAPFGMGDK